MCSWCSKAKKRQMWYYIDYVGNKWLFKEVVLGGKKALLLLQYNKTAQYFMRRKYAVIFEK